ncbi:hypothetical protein C8J57DRAFT_1726649 [Mycena rebaudengoi]|nr:hypothetical protein C8J57DRAFT_1726649 [Mycena rebaudengoi]
MEGEEGEAKIVKDRFISTSMILLPDRLVLDRAHLLAVQDRVPDALGFLYTGTLARTLRQRLHLPAARRRAQVALTPVVAIAVLHCHDLHQRAPLLRQLHIEISLECSNPRTCARSSTPRRRSCARTAIACGSSCSARSPIVVTTFTTPPPPAPRSALKSAVALKNHVGAMPTLYCTPRRTHRPSVSFSGGKRDGPICGLESESTAQPSARSKRIAEMLARGDSSAPDATECPTRSGGPAPASASRSTSASASVSTSTSRRVFSRAHESTSHSGAPSASRLIVALTDIEPFAPHWGALAHVDLSHKGLESAARLKELVPALDGLSLNEPFRRLLDFADGEWEQCRNLIQSIKIWSLMPKAASLKEMLAKCIQEQGLRTYLFTYAPHYSTLSLSLLSRTFCLPLRTVTSIVSKMIWNEELSAFLAQSGDVVVFRRIELSHAQ